MSELTLQGCLVQDTLDISNNGMIQTPGELGKQAVSFTEHISRMRNQVGEMVKLF